MALSSYAKADTSGFKRSADLAQLIGIRDADADDYSLAGRLSIIAKLKAARRIEVARGKAKSWLYDINRHLSLCSALRAEYEALGEFIADCQSDDAVKGTALFQKPEIALGPQL